MTQTRPKSRGIKRRLTVAASVAAGVGLFGFIVHTTGLSLIWAQITRVGGLGALLLFADVSAMVFLWMWSWRVLLHAYGLRPSWRLLARAMLGGYALSYLTPSMYFGGEPLRIYVVAKALDASTSQVTATVVVWKFIEGLTLFAFVLLGSVNALLSGALLGSQELSIVVGNLILIGGLGVLAWNFIGRRFWASGFCRWLERTLPWGRARLERLRLWLEEAETSVHEAFSAHTLSMLQALAISVLTTLTVYVRPWLFFQFSSGLGLSFKELSLIFALFFFLSSFLWLTPGGIGISEGGLIAIFELINGIAHTGIPAASAVAYSLTIKGMELVYVIVGLFVLVHLGLVGLHRSRPA